MDKLVYLAMARKNIRDTHRRQALAEAYYRTGFPQNFDLVTAMNLRDQYQLEMDLANHDATFESVKELRDIVDIAYKAIAKDAQCGGSYMDEDYLDAVYNAYLDWRVALLRLGLVPRNTWEDLYIEATKETFEARINNISLHLGHASDFTFPWK